MLINSVVLFLRDLLPIFILFSFLRSSYGLHLTTRKTRINLVASLIVVSFLVYLFYESLSEIGDGFGIEWLQILCFTLSYCFFLAVVFIKKPNKQRLIASLACVLLCTPHASSFIMFLDIYSSSYIMLETAVRELILGCAIGLSICLSFYFLFSYALHECAINKLIVPIQIFWALFLSGQLSSTTNYLQQMDRLSAGLHSAFDLSAYIHDSSAYAFALKALFGFDSSPSVIYTVCLLSGAVLAFALLSSRTSYFLKPQERHYE